MSGLKAGQVDCFNGLAPPPSCRERPVVHAATEDTYLYRAGCTSWLRPQTERLDGRQMRRHSLHRAAGPRPQHRQPPTGPA